MSASPGRLGKVAIGTHKLTYINSISFNNETPQIENKSFGDTHRKVIGIGIISAGGSIGGAVDPDDTEGQVVVENASISGTHVDDFRVYTDASTYWTSTGEDADCVFNNYNLSLDPDGSVDFTVDYAYNGSVHKVTV